MAAGDRYFDPVKVDADKLLLPKAYRADAELERVAAQAERDVLSEYSRRLSPYEAAQTGLGTVYDGNYPGAYKLSDYVMVTLLGFDADPALADPGLLTAFKAAVADTTVWQLAAGKREPGVTSETGTESLKGKVLRDDAEGPFSPGFSRHLRLYNIDPGAWVI